MSERVKYLDKRIDELLERVETVEKRLDILEKRQGVPNIPSALASGLGAGVGAGFGAMAGSRYPYRPAPNLEALDAAVKKLGELVERMEKEK